MNKGVCFKRIPEKIIIAIPKKYIDGAIQDFVGKKAPAIRAKTGNLAPQGMNGVKIIVIRRSFSFSIVRLAIIAGTLHPDPINIGMNDFPDNPNFLKRRSIIKATRAIYPQSSRIEIRRNKIII